MFALIQLIINKKTRQLADFPDYGVIKMIILLDLKNLLNDDILS